MLTVPGRMDLKQTCRLCLSQGGVLSPIFLESVGGGDGEGRRIAPQPSQPQPTLPHRIMACAPIQVVEGDDLPAQICHRCLYQVERSYDFKEQCETSDRILRQYVAHCLKDFVKEDETESLSPTKSDCEGFSSEEVSSDNTGVKEECQNEDIPMNYSTNLEKTSFTEVHGPKDIKVNLLQSKLSAILHQTTVSLPEEDVDSGLLESLADSDDLQIVGSEGDSMNIGEGENQKYLKIQDDLSDKSESSDEDIHLRCKMCKDTFPDIEVLEVHEATHDASGPPYSCSVCGKVFMERVKLNAHWSVHCGDNPFLCPVCETSFLSEVSLEGHLKSHKIRHPYLCATCDKSFEKRSDLKKHSAVHSDLRPYKCKLCPKEFVRITNFNKHMRVHDGQKPFICSECPKMFRTKGDLHRHEIIHTGQKPYSCMLCNLSFNRKDKLTRHERLHAAGKVFTCTLCPSSFMKPDDLVNHNLFHISLSNGEEEPVQEVATDLSMPSKKEVCSENQTDVIDFNEDESTMDTEPDNQLLICEDPVDEGISDGRSNDKVEEADEKQADVESMIISVDPFQMERMDTSMKESEIPPSFTMNSDKRDFERAEFSPNENDVEENIQENTKPYACEFCPKKFADKSYMKTHQLTHLGIRPHACSYCGKGFFRKRELLRHEAVHTGIKPFSCKVCQKAFARSDKLMRHERTHGEPKNYSCSQCPAVFSRKDELSRHGMCHTGERPHCCSQCFKSFFSRAELTRHEKTHAGLKPFKCDLCDQSFHRRDKLNRHARTHALPSSLPVEANVLGTVHLHDLLAAHCGQHFAAEVCVREEKAEVGDEVKVRVDGSIDARALARLNQNPDIHLIPLKQN